MEVYPTLSSAPITEAVIEIRFLPSISIETLKSISYTLKSTLPTATIETIQEDMISFQVGGPEIKVGPHASQIKSYKLTLNEGKKIIQLSADRFAFSFVGHYSDWNTFSGQALNIWEKLKNAFPVEFITRVGVRFVNNLKLPGRHSNKFIKNLPQAPPGAPITVVGFLSQITLANTEIDAFGRVILGLDRNKAEAKDAPLPIIFDIDVFNLEQTPYKIELLRKKLNNLRGFKNQIFFKSLTEKGLELYK